MKDKKQQIKCPKCGSYNISSTRTAWKWWLIIGILTSWMFGFGLILIIASIILKFVMAKKPNQCTCMSCRYKFITE